MSPTKDPTHLYRERVELVLARLYGARGGDFTSRVDSVSAVLPEDVRSALRQLAAVGGDDPQRPLADGELADFAFRCGQLVERLEHLRHRTASEDLMYVDSDGRALPGHDEANLDALSRFLAARDRVLRKAADFSLKVLAGAVVLLVLGFMLGLI